MLVLSLAFGLVGIDRFILPYLFQPMMADLHLNYQDLGGLVGALAIAWGASAFVTACCRIIWAAAAYWCPR